MSQEKPSEEVQSIATELQRIQMEYNIASMQLSTTLVGNDEFAKRMVEGDDELVDEWVKETKKRNQKKAGGWVDIDESLVYALAEYAVNEARQ